MRVTTTRPGAVRLMAAQSREPSVIDNPASPQILETLGGRTGHRSTMPGGGYRN
jgi:hypothetical protein